GVLVDLFRIPLDHPACRRGRVDARKPAAEVDHGHQPERPAPGWLVRVAFRHLDVQVLQGLAVAGGPATADPDDAEPWSEATVGELQVDAAGQGGQPEPG